MSADTIRGTIPEFSDACVERAYREWSAPDTMRQARAALWVTVFGVLLFAINDLKLLGVGPEAAAQIAARCVVSAWAALLAMRLRRPMEPGAMDHHLLALVIAVDAESIFTATSRPPDFAPMLMVNQTILLALIIFWPLRFVTRALNVCALAVAMVVILRATGNITPTVVVPFSLAECFALVAGLSLVSNVERLRRQEFARMQREKIQMEELRVAKEAAEAADRAKTRFLAIVSHEVRTPMNGVLGVLQLLESSRLDALQHRQVAIARDCAENLTGLLDTIVDYARLGTSVESTIATDFDPRQLAHSIVELLRPRAAAQQTTVHLQIDDDVPAALNADASKLRQVLVNLLSNAVKFTEQGHIDVTLALRANDRQGQLLELVVEDSGIGIPAEKLDRIFDEFTQADDSIARRFGGAGLGLAVCKRLVNLLCGTIGASSAVGTGSCFRVSIPVTVACAVIGHHPASSASRRLKVLVVDDDPINQIVACGLLAQLGHDATPAAGGPAALAELEGEVFDVVLMDLHMPGMDGFETARRIRSLVSPERASVPIVALTADMMLVQDERFAELRLANILPKPLRRDALGRVLAAVDGGTAPVPKRPDRTWSTEASIDLVHLSEQVEALGAAAVARLIHMFRQLGRHLLDELASTVAGEDRHRTNELAHRLGSSASALGLTRLCRLAQRVEQSARMAPSQELIGLATPLTVEFGRTFDALRDLAREARAVRGKRRTPQSLLHREALPQAGDAPMHQ